MKSLHRKTPTESYHGRLAKQGTAVHSVYHYLKERKNWYDGATGEELVEHVHSERRKVRKFKGSKSKTYGVDKKIVGTAVNEINFFDTTIHISSGYGFVENGGREYRYWRINTQKDVIDRKAQYEHLAARKLTMEENLQQYAESMEIMEAMKSNLLIREIR